MRAYINVTRRCNNRCRFCKARVPAGVARHKVLDEIKAELAQARDLGIEFLVLSGGEATTHPAFYEILRCATSIGFRRIQVQTNARRFADAAEADRAVAAGATEFMVSLHGSDAPTHDWHTQRPGSFFQALSGTVHLQAAGATLLTNTVITRHNLHALIPIIRLSAHLRAHTIQLAYLHLTGAAETAGDMLMVSKSEAAPWVAAALDEPVPQGVTIMVEALPFCFLRGHEAQSADWYVSRAYQQHAGAFQEYRRHGQRVKGPPCRTCGLEEYCLGPWREYVERYGWQEFRPVAFSVAQAVIARQCRESGPL